LFNFYAEMYHNGSKDLATSFYIIDYERDEFIECIFLLKKTTENSSWSTFHHFKLLLRPEKTTISCLSGVYSKLNYKSCETSYKNQAKSESSIQGGEVNEKEFIAKMGEMLELNEQ
jgi:hypothetical protein